jgi:hypothetical protein
MKGFTIKWSYVPETFTFTYFMGESHDLIGKSFRQPPTRQQVGHITPSHPRCIKLSMRANNFALVLYLPELEAHHFHQTPTRKRP